MKLERAYVPLLCFCAAMMWLPGCGAEGDDPNADVEENTSGASSWVSEFPESDATAGITSEEMRTIEITDAVQQAGAALYAQNCVPCHGPEGEGRMGTGAQLNSETFLAAASDDFLVRTIGRGRVGTTMPAWGTSMDRSEVESVVAFMRGWNDVEAAELNEAANEGDAEAGATIFREICSACHGLQGGGYMETANGTGIGRSAFLGDASNGFIRYIVNHGKSDTAMRPFAPGAPTAVANLEADEIENVIAHLRASAW